LEASLVYRVSSGQPGRHRVTLSQKKITNKQTNKTKQKNKNTQPRFQEQLEILTRVYGPRLDSQPPLWLKTLWGPELTGQEKELGLDQKRQWEEPDRVAMSLGEVPQWEWGV
jgi:transglutaminase/protease-like cytokinesis protein 3